MINTMAQLGLQEIMAYSLLNSEYLESLMGKVMYMQICCYSTFSEYLAQCNKTRKEVICNKEEINGHF